MSEDNKKDIAGRPLTLDQIECVDNEVKSLDNALEQMRANEHKMAEYAKIRARINKATYDQMVSVGFTAEQAMQFVIQKGV